MRAEFEAALHPADFVASMQLEAHRQAGAGGQITPFTEKPEGIGTASWRADRPALIVSSTSWTPDEDFSMLLAAAEAYDRRCQQEADEGLGGRHPRLLVVVTGKGPMRDDFRRRMALMDLRWVAFRTPWLEGEDYPVLLGSADLGVSLHTSSSGLDLPMKVVDMFGCGLPVCSADYACIQELVRPGVNGLLFGTSEELTEHLMALLEGFPNSRALGELKSNLATPGRLTWEQNWEKEAMPVMCSEQD
mmetsp:Transcript_37330/g.88727  ORF Transcript_37330/g.88727 Transcript_37330/m.88727 type:complete len:247 (+) Transcript_37330:915-1655(+)